MQDHYKSFEDFATDAMAYLGFGITDMQLDIGIYMASGPDKRMVMAQRGEAKSTLAALYAVWRLIQDPTGRGLITSAGEEKAGEVANGVLGRLMHWEIMG